MPKPEAPGTHRRCPGRAERHVQALLRSVRADGQATAQRTTAASSTPSTQLTDTPKRISIAVNKANHHARHDQQDRRVQRFRALADDAPFAIVPALSASRAAATSDKFAGLCRRMARSEQRPDLLSADTARTPSSPPGSRRRIEITSTHTLFIADVTEARQSLRRAVHDLRLLLRAMSSRSPPSSKRAARLGLQDLRLCLRGRRRCPPTSSARSASTAQRILKKFDDPRKNALSSKRGRFAALANPNFF